MFITIHYRKKKDYLKIMVNLVINLKVLCYIMVLLILGIISVILKKVKINGYSLMIKESGNSIHQIFKFNAMEENIGEDKVKALIFLFMKDNKSLT